MLSGAAWRLKDNMFEMRSLIVPPHLYETACKILYSKKVGEFNNYDQYEYKGKKEWSRKSSYGYNYGMFPNPSDEYGFKIKTTKAMRKRHHPKYYDYREWNERFPKFKVNPY